MASMMSKVSRDPARAVRSAASRCATALARSGLGGAAAPDPLLRRYFVTASCCAAALGRSGSAAGPDRLLRRSFVAASLLPRNWLPVRRGRSPIASLPPVRSLSSGSATGKVHFVADEKDLESDEALWNLYERWCKAFNEERSHVEMTRYFGTFKENVRAVHRNSKANLPYKLEINNFTDGKLCDEMFGCFLTPDDLKKERCVFEEGFGDIEGFEDIELEFPDQSP